VHTGFEWWLFAVAVGASAVGGALGMAGGIFVVPILTIFGHVDIRLAIGASLVSAIACSCGSAAAFLRGHLTNIRLAIVLEIATTLGAVSGVLLGGAIPARALFALFAVVLLLSAQQMLVRRGEPSGVATTADAGRWGTLLRLDADRVQRVPLGMTLMYGAGLISSLLGIGSGVLKIPAMDGALRLPIKVSSATSNFMIGVTCAASASAAFMRGTVVTAIAGPVALGSVVGALLGARLLVIASNGTLRVVFIVVLLALAAQMVAYACGILS
jgi:uncharacterized membrane protein YfcA